MIEKNYRPPIVEYNPEKNRPYRYATHKKNGIYLQARKENSNLYLYSKKPSDLTGELYFALCNTQWGRALCELPDGWILLGELYAPNQPASQVKTYIAEGNPALRWECFAAVQSPQLSINQIAGMPIWQLHEELFAYHDIPFVPYVQLPDGYSLGPEQIYKEQTGLPEADLEGLMLKESNLVGWQRYKPGRTIDLVIMGVIAAKNGKFGGLIGSLQVGTVCGKILGHAFGMNDVTRRVLTEMHEAGALVGRVAEVAYQCVESRGRLRHPVFVMLREDKNPAECTLTQDEELVKRWA